MLIDDCIELCSNFRKIPVQPERFHADLITAHLIAVIRLNCFVCCGIQKHSRYLMRFRTEFRLFVLHIGEYLIQITGIQQYNVCTSYIRALKKQPEVMHDWNDTIWTVRIEKAVIHRNGEITFVFANGTEIKVGA